MTAKDESQSASASSDGPAPPPSQIIERLRARPRVEGRYDERGEIARGGMGAVKRVFDADMRRQLAMKVMLRSDADPHASKSAESAVHRRRARFLEEAQITGQLDHPGIVPVHELGLDSQGQLYFTMKLVKGRDLREVFQLVRRGEEGWSLTRALGILLRVCEAVAFAHEKGVIHRDLKPANIMVGRFGEVYVMDWGLAKVLGRPDTHDVRIKPSATASLVHTERTDQARAPESPVATMDGDVVGTPCYMPPEQARGKLEDIGPHSDVYSLGAMLYELLSGEMPYAGADENVSQQLVLSMLVQGPPRPIAKVAPRAPEELIAICEKAMFRDLRGRYPSMLGVAEDLRAFLEGRVVRAHETGAVAEFRKWIARNRGFAGAVATALVVVLALCGAMVWQQVKATRRLQIAKDDADAARRIAETQQSAAESAQRSAEAASERLRESNTQLDAAKLDAEAKEGLAQKSSYVANVAAAAASLRFHDLESARARLADCPLELRGWEWDYLDARTQPQAATLARIDGGEIATGPFGGGNVFVAVEPAERVLVVATGRKEDPGHQATAHFLELESGTVLARTPIGAGLVRALAISPDGARAAVATTAQQVTLLDVSSRSIAGSWSTRESPGNALAFDPASRRIAYSNLDHELVLAAADDGTPQHTFEQRTTRFLAAAFSPDGRHLAAGAFDGRIYVFALDREAPAQVLGEAGAPVSHVEWGCDGLRLLASTTDLGLLAGSMQPWAGTVREWEPASGRMTAMWSDHGGAIEWCSYGRGARLVASVGGNKAIVVRDTSSGQSTSLPTGSTTIIAAASFRGDRALVTASRSGEVQLWDSESGDSSILYGNLRPADQISFLADGERAVSRASDGVARLWNPRTGEALASFPRFASRTAIAVAAAPSDARVAIAYSDGSVSILDANTLEVARDCSTDDDAQVEFLAFDAAGERVAAAEFRRIAVYDAGSGERVAWLRATEGTVALAWLANGRTLATASRAGDVVLWDLATESRTAMLEKFASAVGGLHERAGELWALVPGEIVRLRPDTLDVLSRTPLHGAKLPAVALGGNRCAAAVSGGVAIFDAETGAPLLELRTPEELSALAASPDGRMLIASVDDGTLRTWTTESTADLTRARRAALRARELAVPYLAERFETRGLSREAVEAEILADESISESLRAAALRLARMTRDESVAMRAECLDVVRNPRSERLDYQVALWRALALQRMDAKDDRAVLLEAAARYRLGQFERAGELLDRSVAMRRSSRAATELFAFKALVAFRQGRLEDAHAEHARLQLAMATPIEAARLSNNELSAEVAAWLASAAR